MAAEGLWNFLSFGEGIWNLLPFRMASEGIWNRIFGPSGGTNGTVGAFNNKGKGQQDYGEAEFNTGAQDIKGCADGDNGTKDAFNNADGGVQKFGNAKFNTGAKNIEMGVFHHLGLLPPLSLDSSASFVTSLFSASIGSWVYGSAGVSVVVSISSSVVSSVGYSFTDSGAGTSVASGWSRSLHSVTQSDGPN